MRTTAVVTLTLSAALTLGACQDEVTSAPSSSTPTSTGASTSEGPSSAKNPTPTTRAWSTKAGQPSTDSSAASAARASGREAIKTFDFKNATWTTRSGSRVTMKNGKAQTIGEDGAVLNLTVSPNVTSWAKAPLFYDLDGDGFEDALVTIEEAEGNGYVDTPVVWLGGPNGPRQLTRSALPSAGRCATYIKDVKITDGGTIFVDGAERSEQQSCPEMPNKPFTRAYSVQGGQVVQHTDE